ncbi:MAG: NAD-dependent epimerase/dehydratase family protein [Paenibacillus sp.]|jgi:nucleoside-diphosphate-sugar epimerase|nr:NAD-dependent epimerase/dehydratase family protein [Paenibacillus sp.]
MSKIFIIGGPGNISRGTIDYLQERSYDIAIFTRSSDSKRRSRSTVTFYEGERKDKDALKKAFDDFGAELVVDTICFELEDAKTLYGLLRGNIRQLLFISTVDTYGYPLSRLPFGEQDKFSPTYGTYAAKKRQIELFYLDRYMKESFPVTIGRPSLSIGPKFCPMMFRDWGFTAVPRMKAELPLLVPGDGNGLMHVGWGYDVGRMVGRMIGDAKAIGRDYTLSDENFLTRDAYISLFTTVLGVNPERVYIPQAFIESFRDEDQKPGILHLYRHNMAFSLDRFKRDFPDYQWLPLLHGVEEFIETNERNRSFPPASAEIMDDRIIQEWKRRLEGWITSSNNG